VPSAHFHLPFLRGVVVVVVVVVVVGIICGPAEDIASRSR